MVTRYTVYYYVSPTGSRPIEEFLDSLSEKQQAKILRIFQYLRDYGLSAILPHTKKVTGTPLWEIRILGGDNIRILYALPVGGYVLILHGFVKKSPKTPLKELRLALMRYEQWKAINPLDK